MLGKVVDRAITAFTYDIWGANTSTASDILMDFRTVC